jgi:hypothetical protein
LVGVGVAMTLALALPTRNPRVLEEEGEKEVDGGEEPVEEAEME